MTTKHNHKTKLYFLLTIKQLKNGWEYIRRASCMESNFHFNIGHIVAYFVTRSVSDNKAATDLKSINKSAEGLYNCGHVQVKHSIEDVTYRPKKRQGVFTPNGLKI